MKKKIYLRIADPKISSMVQASNKKNLHPLANCDSYGSKYKKYYPTVLICLNVEIPDALFKEAQVELDVNVEKAKAAAEIKVEEI